MAAVSIVTDHPFSSHTPPRDPGYTQYASEGMGANGEDRSLVADIPPNNRGNANVKTATEIETVMTKEAMQYVKPTLYNTLPENLQVSAGD